VLQLACAQQSRWRRDAAHGHVAVNVSARQLTSDGFVDHVTDTLARNDLTPDSLCIEITESTLIDVGSSAQQRLHDLKAAGVTIALDDFGTGWASLGYLRRFPIDIIKIDRSFVAGLGADDEDAELVKAVVGLGRALDLTTVAEGVETERQDRLLDEFGCNQAQGYFYGRPAPADATAGA
jgi:EAL domain-containing protein (putative c-di-GMP-specific phosphodiesterase class I)